MVSSLSPRRRLLATFAALAGSLALSACDVQMPAVGGNSGQRVDTARAVEVALLVPQTGSAAEVGQSLERAARLAVQDLSGAEIDLDIYDTGGTEAGAVAAAEAALAAGNKIIVGPLFGGNAAAVGRVAAARNVNVLSFSNNPAIAGGNVFILGSTFDSAANRLVRYATSQGKNRIFVIHGQDAAEIAGRDAITSAVARSSASLAGVASFPVSQQGIIDALPGIARQVRGSGADTVFLTSGTQDALPFLAELLPENGIAAPDYQIIGLQRFDQPSSALTLRGIQGAWFALPDRSLTNQFAARYQAAYGARPNPIAGVAYDGIAAIGGLIASGDANALTAGSLTRARGFSGVSGPFRFLPSGGNERSLDVAQVQNNQVVVIDPAPRSFGGAGF